MDKNFLIMQYLIFICLILIFVHPSMYFRFILNWVIWFELMCVEVLNELKCICYHSLEKLWKVYNYSKMKFLLLANVRINFLFHKTLHSISEIVSNWVHVLCLQLVPISSLFRAINYQFPFLLLTFDIEPTNITLKKNFLLTS